MNPMTAKHLLVALLVLTITACGHSSDSEQSTEASTQATTNHPDEQASPTAAKTTPAGQAGPIQGADAPLSAYVSVDDEPLWVAYAYFARAGEPLTDEQELDLFSAAYKREQDVFKKRDIAAAELPKIKAKLDAFKQHAFLKLNAPHSPPLGETDMGPYDFETHSFTNKNCGGKMDAGKVGGIRAMLFEDASLCAIKVDDEATAKVIEGLRANARLATAQTYYFRIDGIDENARHLNATVTHLHTDVLRYMNDTSIMTSDVSF